MQTVFVTNNAYDSVLLVDADDSVVGAWTADRAVVASYLNSGSGADEWSPNYPDETAISDYGLEVGRNGHISDKARREFWNLDLIPTDALRAELNRRIARSTPKPKSLAPCVGCQAPLSARERRKPCPHCGARNPR